MILADVGTALRTGIELHDTSGSQWSLSGRDIFVFGPGRLRGFVSMPRLVISDEEQLVLCATNLRDEVEDILRVIGCTPDILDALSGVPPGWLLFRGARPQKTVPVTPDDSILNVIRPEPLIEIELAGGIRLRQSEWITEFPPEIHVRGEIDSPVSIDNIPATIDAERRYHRQGWDSVGHHVISCAGVSRSYSIVDPEDRSEPWPAYVIGGAASDGSAICGAAVLAPNSSKVGNMLWVPVGTPLLLGANAGEVFRFFPRTDVSSETWPVSVPFTVVWALPAQPLRANKALARVLLFGKAVPPGHLGFSPKTSVKDQRHLLDWARAILNSTRKGLSVEPRTPEVRNLWTEYHRLARQIWKLSR